MTDSPLLPGAHAWRDGSGKPMPVEFYKFLRDLVAFLRASGANTDSIAALEARIAALEAGAGLDATLQGLESVRVAGSLSGGLVRFRLDGDEPAPGASLYYGTDGSGAKGFWPALSNPMTTLGDVITGDVGGVPKRLGVGADGDVLGVVAGEPAYVVRLESVVAGTNVTVDNTDPANPVINASGGGGGGDLVKIAEVVTSGSQATVTFSSIPGTYKHLKMEILGRGTVAATETNGAMRFNGDAGANYDSIRENRFGNANAVGVTAIDAFSLSGASAPAGTASPVTITLPGYANTTFHKSLTALSSLKQANTVAGEFMQFGSGYWRNTAAITQIAISLSAGNWQDGSVVSLYGLS